VIDRRPYRLRGGHGPEAVRVRAARRTRSGGGIASHHAGCSPRPVRRTDRRKTFFQRGLVKVVFATDNKPWRPASHCPRRATTVDLPAPLEGRPTGEATGRCMGSESLQIGRAGAGQRGLRRQPGLSVARCNGAVSKGNVREAGTPRPPARLHPLVSQSRPRYAHGRKLALQRYELARSQANWLRTQLRPLPCGQPSILLRRTKPDPGTCARQLDRFQWPCQRMCHWEAFDGL